MSHASLDIYTVLEAFHEGVYLTDSNGTTLFINSAYEKITGIKREDVIGKNVIELEKEGYFSPILNPSVIHTGKKATVMQTSKTGQKVVVTGYPVRDISTRSMVGTITIVRDFSNLEQLKQEVEAQRDLLQRYREAAMPNDPGQSKMIAASEKMRDVLELTLRLALVDTPVLITGETGSGKEMIAKILHSRSPRKDKTMLSINCAAIPENLLETELFGYAPGAFTGANPKGKAGLFELADQGTLFFDEIGELPPMMQPKLLRVLQNQEIMRMGGSKVIQVNVRIVAATNRNLDEMVKEGRFRQDLLYRLRVASVEIPPLRERPEDIEQLLQLFLARYNAKYNRHMEITSAALGILKRYQWPGNVRELENVVEVLAVALQKNVIDAEDLPGLLAKRVYEDIADNQLKGLMSKGKLSLQKMMDDFERKLLVQAMEQNEYDVYRVAREMDCDRTTIQRKIKKYKLQFPSH
ncbi:MAG: sensor protein [Firmicutes bacterium]|nr:sensor protein [Bacillota bacterium]